MALQASFFKKVFQFAFEARTSRGLMKDKTSWFIKIWDESVPETVGIGECAPLPDLSPDSSPNFEDTIKEVVKNISQAKHINTLKLQQPASLQHFITPTLQHVLKIVPPHCPAITFGMETALLDLMNGGRQIIFVNDFIQGRPIPINGLIWMGDPDFMIHQIDRKLAQGFRCLKLKIGGIDFDRECEVLHYIRKQYVGENITIRLDANGSFRIDEALLKLNELKKFDVHSIEQPIKKGLAEMKELCEKSPIPIAFDEELIGCEKDKRRLLLTRLSPQFITLKPTLHGGLSGCKNWIEIAESMGIGWWVTSALESNIGLNAICQFAANYSVKIPQGLGTGAIYKDNFGSPLRVENGTIFNDPSRSWNSLRD